MRVRVLFLFLASVAVTMPTCPRASEFEIDLGGGRIPLIPRKGLPAKTRGVSATPTPLPAPSLLVPHDGALVLMAEVDFYSSSETGISFRWSEVVGAASYELQIQRPVPDDTPFPPEVWPIHLLGDATERFVSRLPITYSDPNYYASYPWRVRAFGAAGEPGTYGGPFHFTVVAFMPTPTPPKVADVNDDGFIDHGDLFRIAAFWKRSVPVHDIPAVRLDLERDGTIDGEDFLRYLEGHRVRAETRVPVPVVRSPGPDSGVPRTEYLVALMTSTPFYIWDRIEGASTFDLEIEGFTPYPESNGPFLEYDLVGVPVDDDGVPRWGLPPTRSLREGDYRFRVRARSTLGRVSPFSEWAGFTITLQ